MFQSKIVIYHIKSLKDDRVEKDYFEVEVWSPNGEERVDLFTVHRVDVPLLIEKLQEIK